MLLVIILKQIIMIGGAGVAVDRIHDVITTTVQKNLVKRGTGVGVEIGLGRDIIKMRINILILQLEMKEMLL